MKHTIDISNQVMKTIKQQQVTIRSKYFVLAERVGLGGVFGLSILLAVFFLNLAFYSLKTTNALEYLSFGSLGAQAFLESFPFEWLLITIVFLIPIHFIMKKYDFSYKHPITIISLVLLTFVSVSAISLAYSNVNERLAMTDLQPLYMRKGMGKNGIIGKIKTVQDHGLLIETLDNKIVTVNFTQETHFPTGIDFHVGEYVRVVGDYSQGEFTARGIRKSISSDYPQFSLPHFQKGKGQMLLHHNQQ